MLPRHDPGTGAEGIAFPLDRFAFLFDVDGTLLDIAPTPQAVRIPPTLRHDLDRLSALTGGATALVSGRSLADLDHLFGPLHLAMVGGHGAEIRVWRRGQPEQSNEQPLNEWIRRQIADIKAAIPEIIVEDKGYSIALHFRLAPQHERAVLDAVAALDTQFAAQQVEVLHGKAVVEIKRAGINKGSGIRTLMAQSPFKSRRPIFVGDDITDEDAFAAMPEFDGVAISVGRDVAGVRYRFDDPAAVRRWIAHLRKTQGRPAPAAR